MANNIKIIDAILSINSNAKVVVNGSDIDTCTIQWMDGTEEINKTNIETKITELQTAYDALDYQRKRKAEYPSIEELVVALYDTEDKLALENKRAAIKLKYPKESS